ncbi:MAG: GIY-YIG nuclease family protein, partial [Kiritimatiellae bacterium]|nr:GIY-YIG nuclease family protein [Kiritimatiellia bacterium]
DFWRNSFPIPLKRGRPRFQRDRAERLSRLRRDREFEPRLPLHSFFSMIGVYILYSATLDQFYAGLSRHPQHRLKQHLRGQSPWTSRAGDWVMVYQSRCDTMAEARAMEKRIKQHGARRFLEEQLPNPAETGQAPLSAGQG